MSGGDSVRVLRDAQDILATAKCGLQDLTGQDPARRLPGLRNLVVFGRAVTNILQNLRSTEPSFNEWYRQYEDEMKADDLLRYFYDLRTKILKKGILKTSVHIRRLRLVFPQDLTRFGPPPANAKGFFIGDETGGSGWEVQLPNGSVVKYYVELPSDIASVTLHFPDPPRYHLGRKIENQSIEALSRLYLGYLNGMVEAAKNKFTQRH